MSHKMMERRKGHDNDSDNDDKKGQVRGREISEGGSGSLML
jgi:hypothetical protein